MWQRNDISGADRENFAVATHERKMGATKRSLLKRLILAAMAIVATVFTAWLFRREWVARREPLARLVAAAATLDSRPVEPRVTGLPYAPYSIRRGRDDLHDRSLWRLRSVAGEIAADSGAGMRPETRGVALLLAGHTKDAVATLARAATDSPFDATLRSDLAAARYIHARDQNDPRELVSALAATDDALRIDCHLESALFNRALILDALHLADPAIDAYQGYLLVDSMSAWATEVRGRVNTLGKRHRTELWGEIRPKLERAALAGDTAQVRFIVGAFSQESRSWGELMVLNDWAVAVELNEARRATAALTIAREIGRALREREDERLLAQAVAAIDASRDATVIARAQRTYFRGRELYRDREVAPALPLFAEAEAAFAAEHSPMAFVSAYYRGMCLDDLNRVDVASAVLQKLSRTIDAGHRALRAQIDWQYGARLGRAGLLNEALTAQRGALKEFAQLGEHANADFMRNAMAGTQAALGRDAESWRIRADLFRSLSDTGDRRGMQTSLDLAARTEALANRWESAHALLTLAVARPLRVNPRLVVDDLLWSALAAARIGDPRGADDELRFARAAMTDVKDPALRASAEATAAFVEARIVCQSRPRDAIALLDQVIDYMSKTHNPFLLPEALLERGRSLRAAGNEKRAVADLHAALEAIDRRRGLLGDTFRDTYFATADAAAEELTDILVRRGRMAEAVATADSTRGRSIADHVARKSNPVAFGGAWWRDLPDGIVIAEYQTFEDRVVVFTIDRKGVQGRTAEMGRQPIRADVMAVIDAPDSANGRRAAERLFSTLIAPIAHEFRDGDTLVVVPDKTLLGLPFAVLRNAKRQQCLIENMPVVVSPNVGVYMASLRLRRAKQSPPSLLALGDPAFDRAAFPALEQLSGAPLEIRTIAAMYKNAETFVGSQATRSALLDRLNSASIVHIAVHAVSVNRDPANSFLLLTPTSGNSGALYGHEIAVRSVQPGQLVVLAGCRTAARAEASTDLTSLALAFLTAGASTTIGTVWNADDETSLWFSDTFYRFLRRGKTPAVAARLTQLAMLRSSDSRLNSVRAWGAFQVLGSGF